MESKSDQAIVLRARDYREADSLVSLFTSGEGKISGIAKGAKKSKRRFGPALEMGSLIDLVYEDRAGGELVLLKEASLLNPSLTWRSSWTTITVASFALELALRLLPERQASFKKFELLKGFLVSLTEESATQKLLTFEFDWLSLSGWEPNLEVCGVCGLKLDKKEGWATRQQAFDHYWQHILGKPLHSRKLLDKAFL